MKGIVNFCIQLLLPKIVLALEVCMVRNYAHVVEMVTRDLLRIIKMGG